MKSGCKQMTDDAKRALEAIEQAIPETILGCNLVGPGPHTLEYFPNPARAALATIRAALERYSDPCHDASADPVREAARAGVYVASKCKHAPMWRQLRSAALPVISTWIDEAGEGETGDYAELAIRCLEEVANAERVILYCEPGDVLKGALQEVGAALVLGIPVYCVGDCESVSRVFRKHPLWHDVASMQDACPQFFTEGE